MALTFVLSGPGALMQYETMTFPAGGGIFFSFRRDQNADLLDKGPLDVAVCSLF